MTLSLALTSCTSKVDEIEAIKKEDTSQVEKAACKGKECQVCVLPWGDTLPHGQTLKNVYSKELASCEEQCDALTVTLECESGTLYQVNKTGRLPFQGAAFKSCYKKKCDCAFKTETIADGTERDFFKHSSRICDDKCEKKTLKCVSGKIVDPASSKMTTDITLEYSYLGCEQLPCAKCLAPWNEQIDSGTKVFGYKGASLACKDNCASATNRKEFTCYNGNFKEAGINDFPNKSCMLNACRQCNLPCSKTINDGENAYCFNIDKSSTCGDMSCANNNVRFYCADSVLKNGSGSILNIADYTSYSKPSCTADECKKCTAPWGNEYLSGSKFYAFKSTSLECGKDCNTTDNRAELTCTNGTISGGDTAILKYGTCQVADCKPCTLPCGKQVSSGGYNSCYSASLPKVCGETCNKNEKTFYCFDGKVTDSNKVPSSAGDLATYTSASCTESNAACLQCKTPDGKIIEDNKKVTFYKSSLVECDASCLDSKNAVTLTCSDGQFGNKLLYPDFNYTTCKTKCDGVANGNRGSGRIEGTGGGAPVNLCKLPWANQVVTHNTEVVAYSKGSVPKGSSCAPYKKIITCNAYKGLWTGGAVYIYPTCYVEN